MAKDKGGREAKTPKAAKNIKVKGQTPLPGSAATDAVNRAGKK